MILRLALREIKNERWLTIFFIANLCFGLIGFSSIEILRSSLDQTLEEKSKTLLTADISMSARRLLTDEEFESAKAWLSANGYDFRTSEQIELFTMVTTDVGSKLVRVKGVDETFPLIGEVETAKKEKLTDLTAWVYPELLEQLSLKIGDSIKIGELRFTIRDVVEKDVGSAFRFLSFAPNIYIPLKDLLKTDLLRQGTTLTHTQFFIVDHPDTEGVAQKLAQIYDDPAIKVQGHRSASEDVGRLLDYLSDYLALASLVGLFLASFGASFIFRTLLIRRLRALAIYKAMGLTAFQLQSLFIFSILILSISSVPISFASSILLVPPLLTLIKGLIPFELTVDLDATILFKLLFVAIIMPLLSCLPLLRTISHLRVQSLFQESPDFKLNTSKFSAALWTVPMLVFLFIISLWQAKSFLVAGLFFLCLVISWFVIFLIGEFLLRSISTLKTGRIVGLATRNITRLRREHREAFITLSLGSLLLTLIPQLKSNLSEELQRPDSSSLPSLFLFDIQDDQLPEISRIVQATGGQLNFVSPMVRARLASVNGEKFEKVLDTSRIWTREEEQQARSRNRAFNLTYREGPTQAESIFAGRPFSGTFDETRQQVPEVSVERRFADRLGLKIGDQLVFDIQGFEIKGAIVNLRNVRWTSFQPNFFIVFQPGVLESAPKTFLASMPALAVEPLKNLQIQIASRFPNVSLIDVGRAVSQILELVDQIGWALLFMSALSILAGLVVLSSVVKVRIQEKRYEIGLLKVLGMKLGDISKTVLMEFGIVAAISILVGALLSVVVSYFISVLIFDGAFTFDFGLIVFVFVVGFLMSMLTIALSMRKGLKQSVNNLLLPSESVI